MDSFFDSRELDTVFSHGHTVKKYNGFPHSHLLSFLYNPHQSRGGKRPPSPDPILTIISKKMANIMTLDKLRVKEARGDVISWEYKPPRGNIWTLQDIRDRDCFGRVSVRGNSEESYKLMMSVVEKVKVIMRRRRWYIDELQELDPGSKYLGLNVGHTLEIHLKLRTWRGPISHNDLVLTMLHELTHIINSSHNDDFYALFYRLKAEYETHYGIKLSTKTRTTQCGNGVEPEEQRRKRVSKWKRFYRRLFRIKNNERS